MEIYLIVLIIFLILFFLISLIPIIKCAITMWKLANNPAPAGQPPPGYPMNTQGPEKPTSNTQLQSILTESTE